MYDVVQKVNGNLVIRSSWADDQKAKAKQAFHDTCRLLYADTATTSGIVATLDDNLDVVDGCKEFIKK
ncbi:hypothetical protein [Butyrivibrio sp. INlla21]|uniref:hypothetical protein n=1 Tax=Butyrivibrio sp. INlla21 TaxID=1520811 RepID=UPI0008E5767B|nr:hypothetical protein [Butyrivibrio sp. INlla21]SFU35894.1 hypothetical protein SAMN02910342_00229 [Butyrivibrio sp. INlla21]